MSIYRRLLVSARCAHFDSAAAGLLLGRGGRYTRSIRDFVPSANVRFAA